MSATSQKSARLDVSRGPIAVEGGDAQQPRVAHGRSREIPQCIVVRTLRGRSSEAKALGGEAAAEPVRFAA
jgi:hypothetical protein